MTVPSVSGHTGDNPGTWARFKELALQVGRLLRSFPQELDAWARRAELSPHQPVDVGEDEQHPHPFCMRCKADWPCDKWAEIEARHRTWDDQP